MAFSANARQYLPAFAQPRTSAVCRVHSCARCHDSIESAAPCSFVATAASVCRLCRSQEQVSSHLPAPRAAWAISLARMPRGA
jgi:hypothetical protein